MHARAVLEVAVEARLRAVLLVVHRDALRGRRGAPLGLHGARVRAQRVGGARGGRRGAPRKVHGDARGVALEHGHAVARRGHGERARVAQVERLVVVDDAAEDLCRLAFHLRLLVGDVRHDVVEDVERGHAGVPGARDGLHRRDHALVDGTEGVLEGAQRDDEARGRAVGIGDDKASHEVVQGTLGGDDVQVVGVDERDDERDCRVLAVVFGIGEHRDLR